MDDLRGIELNVVKILKQIPVTRSNDMILYYEYCINNWVREIDMWKVFKDRQTNVCKYSSIEGLL